MLLMRRLKALAKALPAPSLGSNKGETRIMTTGMQMMRNSADRAMSILVRLISLLDKLEEVWLRQRTMWVSLTAVMVVVIKTTAGQPTVKQKP